MLVKAQWSVVWVGGVSLKKQLPAHNHIHSQVENTFQIVTPVSPGILSGVRHGSSPNSFCFVFRMTLISIGRGKLGLRLRVLEIPLQKVSCIISTGKS